MLDDKSLIVAHSCGADFALRSLVAKPCIIEHLVLVAPWLDTQNRKGQFLVFIRRPISLRKSNTGRWYIRRQTPCRAALNRSVC